MLNVRSEFFEAMNIYIAFLCVLSSIIKTGGTELLLRFLRNVVHSGPDYAL